MFRTYPVFSPLEDRPSAHCATLAVLPDQTLLAAWFGGAYEMSPEVVLLAARRRLDEDAWSAPQVIAEVPGHSLGQPVFLVRPDGELWLFFDVVMEQHWVSAQPHWQRSRDGGLTWGAYEPLLDYPGLMFRSKPLVLADRIILPAYDETTWQSRMLISDDDGRSWRLTAPLTTPQGNIHPGLVPLSDGRLLAYLRTGGKGGNIWRTISQDRGDTWTEPERTPFPNPNAGIDLIRLRSGRLALAFNNSDQLRTPLCVALGTEDEQWQPPKTLESGAGEFSYPTLLQTDDEIIHLVYTYKRQHIQYACFGEDWLQQP